MSMGRGGPMNCACARRRRAMTTHDRSRNIMCGIVAARRRPQHRPGPDRRPAQARISRLRFGRHGRAQRRLDSACAAVGRVAELATQAEAGQARASVGIAHTRWATHGVPSRAQCASARLAAGWRWCITASSRTTKRSARDLNAARLRVRRRTPIPRSIAHLIEHHRCSYAPISSTRCARAAASWSAPMPSR